MNSYIYLLTQILPGFNAVKHFENKYSQKYIFWGITIQILIDDIPYQVLANPVGSAIHVCKLVFSQNRVIREISLMAILPPKDIHTLLNKIEVVFKRGVIGSDFSICHCNE